MINWKSEKQRERRMDSNVLLLSEWHNLIKKEREIERERRGQPLATKKIQQQQRKSSKIKNMMLTINKRGNIAKINSFQSVSEQKQN